MGNFSTLVEVLRWRALRQPEHLAYAYLLDGEVEGGRLTYAELDCEARTIAALLQTHCASGQRALLIYPTGLEFIAAFFGCLYAGVVAVPAYLPRLNRPMPRLRSLVADAQPTMLLTCSSQIKDLPRWEAGVPELSG